MQHWQTTRFVIDLTQPRVMGIVNVTPDSFSDGGRHLGVRAAIAHCERLLQEGADILDIGAESSRPGAPVLTVDEEWARLKDVLPPAIALNAPISLDTCKPEIMRRALDLGVDIINDIHALEFPGAEAAVAAHPACGVCLMHMRGQPDTMQAMTAYDDVLEEVRVYLAARAGALRAQGVEAARITLDPGVGFGKTPEQNLRLLARQSAFLQLGYPVLIGWSRKSTLGQVTGRAVGERLPASLAAAVIGVMHGARVVRVHDVAETVDVIKVWQAMRAQA